MQPLFVLLLLQFNVLLFQGDHGKVKALNKKVCNKMGFENWIPVSGQTYPRKLDFNVLSALSGIAQSAYKMASDIRLLASMKQVRFICGKNVECCRSACGAPIMTLTGVV